MSLLSASFEATHDAPKTEPSDGSPWHFCPSLFKKVKQSLGEGLWSTEDPFPEGLLSVEES